MKKLHYLFFFLLLCCHAATAQTLIGKITDQDSARTPLFLAEVTQLQDGRAIATYKTYFDGTYRIKVAPGQTYQLRVSFPGRSDTTVSISVDKHSTLYSGTLFISLRKDGMRLTGFIIDQAQDIPIKDACIVLRNVMTREEERYTTDVNGSYNLKMDYETNYTLRIDKMSPGIINKYQDTSFNISTIGFNKPLDFRLDIRLGPTNGYIAPRPEYDPHAKPVNRNLKPVLVVLGAKDSVRKHEQDSIVASLNKKLSNKDSLIASLEKQINDISKTKNETKVVLRDVDTDERKKEEEAEKIKLEADRQKQIADEQKKKDIEKAETDLKAKKQAEKELQAKLDKEIRDAETRKNQQLALAAERQLQDITAARAKAHEDSLLKVALAKSREMLARRKHIKDSLSLIEDQKTEVKVNLPKSDLEAWVPDTSSILQMPAEKETAAAMARKKAIQDSFLNEAEINHRNVAFNKKRVLDSLINIESQKPQIKTDMLNTVEAARIQDSIRIQRALQAQQMRKLLADSVQAEQDSLLRIAMVKNKEILSRRKHIADSLSMIKTKKLQAINETKKLEKEKQDRELIQKQLAEKQELEALEKQQAEIAEREKKAKELAQLKKAKEEQELAAVQKAEEDAALRKTQLEKDLADIKKARQDAETKVLSEKREKEAAERNAKKESKRIAKELEEQNKKQKLAQDEAKRVVDDTQRIAARKSQSEAEQRELEAKKALEEQEKNQLKQQLNSLQQEGQYAVTKDQETKQQDYNPDQALKNEKANTISTFENKVRQENNNTRAASANTKTPAASMAAKLIKAKGFVKNGQTEDPIPNVSINIRRLNSIVSQEVTSDANGQYDILVDSGYFYLVSYYKDKYEISKQILDLTSYKNEEYTMVIQYLKERDDFDPNAKMPVIQFTKNSSKMPADVWGDLQTIIKMMKETPDLKIKLYGLASLDEDYPMELSVTRARLVADLLLESGIKPSRMRINGIGAYRPRSGCTEGKLCSEDAYKLDRVVMYKVIKE